MTEGQSEGTGARRDTAEDGDSERGTKKRQREESERGETEKKTNDHMKRKSHKERDFATQKATVLCLRPPSKYSGPFSICCFSKGT